MAPKGNKNALGNNGGRPTEYKPEYAEQARKLTLLGAIIPELADFFEVSNQTIHNWRKQHSEFFDAIKKGKEIADANVARRLYERATGYSHKDVHISNYQGDITVTEITKQYPPETAAAIFWLKNRQPQKWREKQDLALTFENLSDEQLDILVKKLINNISDESKNG